MNTKQFMEIKDQLQQLKDRGLDVSGFQEKDFISMNYYKVVNGYKEWFLDKSATSEKYIAGATLLEVVDLYLFDMKLSSIFIKYLLEAERKIVSVFSYYFTKRFGNEAHLDMKSYDATKDTQTIKDCIQMINDFLSKTEEASITHYKTIHTIVPFWVLTQHIDFGKTKAIFMLADPLVRKDVADHFKLSTSDFEQYFSSIYVARNKVAHNNRFFNLRHYTRINKRGKTVPIFIIPISNHNGWANKNNITGDVSSGLSDVAAVIMSLSKIIIPSTTKRLLDEVDALLAETSFSSIQMSAIKYVMGLPLNIFDIVK